MEKLKAALVGRSIVSTLSEGDGVHKVLSFVLDDGSILYAHATDGGCACSNGCFTVEWGQLVEGTITNVEVKEVVDYWNWDTGDSEKKEVVPRSISDGSAEISIFVYTELGKQELVKSEGGDNGYYGWGFWLHVVKPESLKELT